MRRKWKETWSHFFAVPLERRRRREEKGETKNFHNPAQLGRTVEKRPKRKPPKTNKWKTETENDATNKKCNH